MARSAGLLLTRYSRSTKGRSSPKWADDWRSGARQMHGGFLHREGAAFDRVGGWAHQMAWCWGLLPSGAGQLTGGCVRCIGGRGAVLFRLRSKRGIDRENGRRVASPIPHLKPPIRFLP
jgi:hypothetical protein